MLAVCQSVEVRAFRRGCPSVCCPLWALAASVSDCLPALLLPLLGLGAVYSCVSTPVDLVLQVHARPTRLSTIQTYSRCMCMRNWMLHILRCS